MLQRAREAAAYAIAARRPADEQVRALIFAQGRTGSTLLESLICASGRFAGYGELLGQSGSQVYLPVRYVEGHARLRRHRHFVCHVKLYHLTRDRQMVGRDPVDPGAFLQATANRGYRILFLRRQNLLRHVLSNWMAEARGDYHKTDDRPETATVRIEKERLRTFLAEKERFAAEERRAVSTVPYHEIIYERDLENAAQHQSTIDGVMRFLGLPTAPVSTKLRKINARPLSEMVANYEEVRRWAVEFGRADNL